MVPWGMASDRFGRRSVLLLGPLGLSLAMLGFGASTQFYSLVVFRWMQGAFNGNIGKFPSPTLILLLHRNHDRHCKVYYGRGTCGAQPIIYLMFRLLY